MIHRALSPSAASSFFLLGPRGTGKSTLLRSRFPAESAVWIDLLDADEEARLSRRPMELADRLAATAVARPDLRWVVIDEVQKVPALLDVVHREIERGRFLFALTGSSARRLRRGAPNLLAGRAFTYHLFPLTFRELGESAELDRLLRFGGLPRLLPTPPPVESLEPTAPARPARMIWTGLLARVFAFDVNQCGCGGRFRFIAAIDEPTAIEAVAAAIIASGHRPRHRAPRGPPPRAWRAKRTAANAATPATAPRRGEHVRTKRP